MTGAPTPADQGLAAAALAEQARQHMKAAEEAARAAEEARRLADEHRNGAGQ